jgi:hypothetical protein
MVHYFPRPGGMRYRTGSSRARHNDRGARVFGDSCWGSNLAPAFVILGVAEDSHNELEADEAVQPLSLMGAYPRATLRALSLPNTICTLAVGGGFPTSSPPAGADDQRETANRRNNLVHPWRDFLRMSVRMSSIS